MATIAEQIVIEKSAVITFENEVSEMAFRRYFKTHWAKLTTKMEMHWTIKRKRFWSHCYHSVWIIQLYLWTVYKSQNPIGHCHNRWKAKVFSIISKLFCFLKWYFLLSSELSSKLQDIEKGNHDDEACEEYCDEYEEEFSQELADCQFKGNKSKIQKLIRKVHI